MDYQAMVEYRNTHNPFAQRLGIVVEEIRSGYGRTVKTVGEEDLNPLGLPHGGVYLTLADTACGSAAATHGRLAVTMSSTWNYLRSAALGDTLTAEAVEVKAGRTICVYDVRIYREHGENQDRELLGNGSYTFYITDRPIPC